MSTTKTCNTFPSQASLDVNVTEDGSGGLLIKYGGITKAYQFSLKVYQHPCLDGDGEVKTLQSDAVQQIVKKITFVALGKIKNQCIVDANITLNSASIKDLTEEIQILRQNEKIGIDGYVNYQEFTTAAGALDREIKRADFKAPCPLNELREEQVPTPQNLVELRSNLLPKQSNIEPTEQDLSLQENKDSIQPTPQKTYADLSPSLYEPITVVTDLGLSSPATTNQPTYAAKPFSSEPQIKTTALKPLETVTPQTVTLQIVPGKTDTAYQDSPMKNFKSVLDPVIENSNNTQALNEPQVILNVNNPIIAVKLPPDLENVPSFRELIENSKLLTSEELEIIFNVNNQMKPKELADILSNLMVCRISNKVETASMKKLDDEISALEKGLEDLKEEIVKQQKTSEISQKEINRGFCNTTSTEIKKANDQKEKEVSNALENLKKSLAGEALDIKCKKKSEKNQDDVFENKTLRNIFEDQRLRRMQSADYVSSFLGAVFCTDKIANRWRELQDGTGEILLQEDCECFTIFKAEAREFLNEYLGALQEVLDNKPYALNGEQSNIEERPHLNKIVGEYKKVIENPQNSENLGNQYPLVAGIVNRNGGEPYFRTKAKEKNKKESILGKFL